MTEKWTKKCEKCETNFIPDEYEYCDQCILDKFDLVGSYASDDWEGLGHFYYKEEDVVRALRRALKAEI